MNRNIKCPKCNDIIENERFDLRGGDNDLPWYKYAKTGMYCPHCGTRLKYNLSTNTYIYFTGTIFLFLAISSILKFVPVYAVVAVPLILTLIFWKIRKLCVY